MLGNLLFGLTVSRANCWISNFEQIQNHPTVLFNMMAHRSNLFSNKATSSYAYILHNTINWHIFSSLYIFIYLFQFSSCLCNNIMFYPHAPWWVEGDFLEQRRQWKQSLTVKLNTKSSALKIGKICLRDGNGMEL